MKYIEEKNFIAACVKTALKKFYKAENLIKTQKSEFDLVTEIDKKTEDYLKARISKEYPSDGIISEETLSAASLKERTWIIDPVDGTCNMARGITLFGVQCALIVKNKIVMSYIFLPECKEEYYAIEGHGAYLNGERIKTDNSTTLENSIISLGDYSHKSPIHAELQHKAAAKLYPRVAKLRMFGASCRDFAYLAAGRTDGCAVMTDNLWDLCPGVLLCREAGAFVTNVLGEEYSFGEFGIIAGASEKIHDLLVEAFN